MKNLVMPLCLCLAASVAGAHVSLEEPAAVADSSYKATLRVSHGCEGSATHTVRVLIPRAFRGTRPMPKAGWTLQTRRATLDQPYESHGRTVTEDVVEVVWKAASRDAWLEDAHYDEFVLRGRTPTQPGPIWFQVQQLCEKGQWNWFDTPADPKSTSSRGLKAPAALLEVLPGMGADAHRH
jgi:uncharacterized protein YcnI